MIMTLAKQIAPHRTSRLATAWILLAPAVRAPVRAPVPIIIGIMIMPMPAIAGGACGVPGGSAISRLPGSTVGGAVRGGRFTSVVVTAQAPQGLDAAHARSPWVW